MSSRIKNSLGFPIKKDLNCGERNELEFCVICCSQVKSDNGNVSLLSKNLTVIFLLRKVLQVPDCHLEENLSEFGDPLEWIRLCEQCIQLTKQAEDLYRNIVKIEKELRSIQHLIVGKIRSSSLSQNERLSRKAVWTKTREFSLKCKPLVVNPFIEGDKLAEYLQSQQGRVSFLLPDKHENNLETEPDQDLTATGSCPNIKLEADAEDDTIVDDDWSHYDGGGDLEMDVKLEMTTEKNEQEVASKKRSMDRRAGYKRKRSFGLSSSVLMRKRRNQKMIRINGKLKCRYCDKLFAAMSTCLLHEKEKHPRIPGQFPCDICGKPWNSRDYLRDHRRSVHGITPTGISVVSKKKEELKNISNRSSGLIGVGKKQRKAEKVDGKWKCRHCDQMFSAASSCYLHERQKHVRIPGQFICDICGKPWNSRDYLRDHRRRIHGVNPDGSTIVLKRKRREIKLKDGEKVKKEVKPRKIRTRSTADLGVNKVKRKKIKMENVDGKWKCRQCDQLFKAKSSVYLHEREKHADKPGEFICDICGKTWNSRDYLRDHRRSTHGLNPDGSKVETRTEKIKFKNEKTKCRHCDKVFATQRTCHFHEKEKHAENPDDGSQKIICDICGQSWNTQEYFRKHRRSKHKMNADGTPIPKPLV